MAAHYCPDCGKVRTAAEGVLCIECGKKAVRSAFAKACGK